MADRILDDARNLALAVAPELTDAPFYVLDQPTAEAGGLGMAGLRGAALVWATFPLPLAAALGPRYVGPGRFIALNLDAIREDANPGGFEQATLAVALHEVGHIVPAWPMIEAPDTPGMRDLHAALLADTWSRPDPPPGHDPHHSLSFVRRVCHLIHRARAAGHDVHTRDALRSMGVFLAGGDRYAEALRGECEALKTWDFAAIEATRPPKALEDAWAEDSAFLTRLGRGMTWA